MNEQEVSNLIQSQFTEGSELNLNDATKMIGCYKALAKIGIEQKGDNLALAKNKPCKRHSLLPNHKNFQNFSEQFLKLLMNIFK